MNPEWERSPETDHEPPLALFADHNGLALIFELLEQTRASLLPGGSLILEADPEQHAAIIKHAAQYKLVHVATVSYGVLLEKVA